MATAGHAPRSRPAVGTDGPDLARLAVLAREHVAAERGGDTMVALDPDRFRPPAVGARDGGLVLCGCLGDVVVGYATARTVPAGPPGSGPVAEVRALFVEPAARGVGVGRLLMDGVVAWAGAQGCRGVDAVALPGDRATKNFFEAFGLTARLLSVHRPLGDRAAGG